MPPGWVSGINPEQDVGAAISRMSSGLSTLADESALLGRDWKNQMRLMKRIKETADRFGLVLKGVNEIPETLAIDAGASLPTPAQAELNAEKNQ